MDKCPRFNSFILGSFGFLVRKNLFKPMMNSWNNFKKLVFSIAACFSFQFAVAQAYPAFNVTAYTPASTGYYFIIPFVPGSGDFPTHMILDSVGRVVYYKPMNVLNSGDFKILPNGLMSYSWANKFYLMDSTFTIVDSLRCQNGIITDTHDLQLLPNGNFLLLGYEYETMDLSSYYYFGPNNNLPGNTNANVRCVVVQELDPNDNVVFEWHSKDYFAFADVDPFFLAGPSNVDWTHSNSVEMDDDGNIIISSRHFNEITKINRSDSSIMWRLGGNANQFTSNDPSFFRGQHDARRIANGNLTLFDNGRTIPFHCAAAKEYQIDENLMTATLVWSYVEDSASNSVSMGNTQRVSNGNTVVGYGNLPTRNYMFNVVDSTGAKVFEVTFLDTMRTYRAYNYPTLPWTLDRPQVSCYMVASQLYLDAGAGYGSYQWSTGDTTQVIAVSAADTFSVFVPNGLGGFISSDFLVITNPATYCVTTAVHELADANFEINPNPVTDELRIDLSFEKSQHLTVQIYDVTGKCVFEKQESNTGQKLIIPASGLSAGAYYLMINGTGKKFMKQ